MPTRVMVLPLLAAGEVIGSLMITGLDDGEIDESSLNLFSVIAAQLSAPLALARIKQRSRDKTRL